jgi:hypothetical protein
MANESSKVPTLGGVRGDAIEFQYEVLITEQVNPESLPLDALPESLAQIALDELATPEIAEG